MSYAVPPSIPPGSLVMGVTAIESCGLDIACDNSGGAGASQGWTAANRALFYPLTIQQSIIAQKMYVANGTTASGNVDVGLYDTAGTRLVSSGSTAMSGTVTLQVIDITDTLLTPGRYLMALAVDNTSAIFLTYGTSNHIMQALGARQMDSAFTLPSSATFANYGLTQWVMRGLGIVARSVDP